MDPTLVGSIVSAIAAIIAAVLGSGRQPRGENKERKVSATSKNAYRWLLLLFSWVILFMSLTALLKWAYWDILIDSCLLFTAIYTVVLSIIFPIWPFIAAIFSSVVILITFSILVYVGVVKYGDLFLIRVRPFDPEVLLFLTVVIVITVIFVWLATYWRIQRSNSGAERQTKRGKRGDLSRKLSELSELYRAGVLTEQEFSLAKSKLLRDREPNR
ncbi:MAG: SHOCT domain-containing protein [Methyloligellaceae bacterium]